MAITPDRAGLGWTVCSVWRQTGNLSGRGRSAGRYDPVATVRGGVVLDWLIRGATVVDGTGAVGVRADVGGRDGRVVEFGPTGESARVTVDADGLMVCPGF